MTIRFLVCLALLSMQTSAQTSAPATAVEVAKSFGFTDAEVQKIEHGAIISKDLKEGSNKELAGVVAVWLPKPVAEFADMALEGKLLKFDSSIRPLHVWKPDESAEKAFADLGLEAKESGEIEVFLQASPGGKLNLADDEIKRFRNLQSKQAVNAELQAMLKARYEAYRKNGLKGIAPYARGGKNTALPGEQLMLAIKETRSMDRLSGYSKALLNYPADPLRGMEHRFFAYKQVVEGRPMFILSHRAGVRGEHDALITEQRYYVGHTYDCRFIASDCFEVSGGTLLFYVNRTFTDQVAGMGGGLKHSIGRKQMLSDVADSLKRVREQLQK